MTEHTSWTGTAADLLRVSTTRTSSGASLARNPRALAGHLRRAQTFLRAQGISLQIFPAPFVHRFYPGIQAEGVCPFATGLDTKRLRVASTCVALSLQDPTTPPTIGSPCGIPSALRSGRGPHWLTFIWHWDRFRWEQRRSEALGLQFPADREINREFCSTVAEVYLKTIGNTRVAPQIPYWPKQGILGEALGKYSSFRFKEQGSSNNRRQFARCPF